MKRVVLKGILFAVSTFLSVFSAQLSLVLNSGNISKEQLFAAILSSTVATGIGVVQYLDKAVANLYTEVNNEKK